jgi:hypothetical protein
MAIARVAPDMADFAVIHALIVDGPALGENVQNTLFVS